MTDQTVKTDGAELVHADRIVEQVKSLQDIVKSAKTELHGLVSARDEKMDDLRDDLDAWGEESAETKAKVDEISTEFREQFKTLQKALDAVDELQAKLDSPAFSKSEKDQTDHRRELALEFFQTKHALKHAGSEGPTPELKESTLSDDAFETFDLAMKAFDKVLRMPVMKKDHMHSLDADEQKAISTLNYGSEMILPIEMSNKLIKCWEDDTQFENLFDIMTIGKESVQLMVEYDEEAEGTWNCETDCSPRSSTDPIELGLRTFVTGELSTEHCVTNRMLDDAEIDIPSMLVSSVSRKFQKLERDVYMRGDGMQKPDGILNDGNHVAFSSNVTGLLPSGEFGWQDLVAMYWKFPQQFRSGASWWFHEDALVKLFTMTDADGNPIMNQNAFAMSGLPKLMGKTVMENTYMPDYIDTDSGSGNFGDPIVGSKPVALGNWREGYMRVNRKGFTVLRDPWSLVRCGVVWHFRRRLGGGVKCPNAMWFLEIV